MEDQEDRKGVPAAPSGHEASPSAADASSHGRVPNAKVRAEFSQSRNDMHWKIFDAQDGFIRWSGYDDDHWWLRVSASPGFRERTGEVTGRRYLLHPDTDVVHVFDASGIEAPSGDETRSGSAAGESPVGEAETPNE